MGFLVCVESIKNIGRMGCFLVKIAVSSNYMVVLNGIQIFNMPLEPSE